MHDSRRVCVVLGTAWAMVALAVLPAIGVSNDWIDGGTTVPRLWSDPLNWLGGTPVNGVGDAVVFAQALGDGAADASLDVDVVLTIGQWPHSKVNRQALSTSAGAMTWDNGAVNAYFEGFSSYLFHDGRDMILTGQLDYKVSKQRGGAPGASATTEGARMVGTVSGDGKLNLDVITSNHDAEQNSRFWIEGAAPNTYAGGTDLKAYVSTAGYGRWLYSDVDMIVANKNGASAWETWRSAIRSATCELPTAARRTIACPTWPPCA